MSDTLNGNSHLRLAMPRQRERIPTEPSLMTLVRPDAIEEAEEGSDGDEEARATATCSTAKSSSDRVLLVEDNPVNQLVAIAMLENLGFCVDVVDNGVEAVITATMVPYRAILMDCQVPALNGYEATKEIRGQEGASRSTPIIAVTASVTESDRKRCIAAGMDGLLAKPLNKEALAAGMALWAPDEPATIVGLDPTDPCPTTDEEQSTLSDPERPALDAEVVGRLAHLGAATGEDLLGELAGLFLDDANLRIVALREALADQDGQAIIRSAHTLCGASANLGAAELSRLCARLATDGAVWGPERTEVLLQSVETELERVRHALGVQTGATQSTDEPSNAAVSNAAVSEVTLSNTTLSLAPPLP